MIETLLPRRRSLLLLPLLLVTAALPAAATSFVMVSDADLADQATIVADVHIASVEPSPATVNPATDYLVDIDHLIKGYTPGTSVLVRVPGGLRADGVGLKIWGAPQFREGERAILFLKARQDGTYAILHLMLGAFHVIDLGTDKRPYAMRDLSQALEVKPQGGSTSSVPGHDYPRDLEKFTAWMSDWVGGDRRLPDYYAKLSQGDLKSLHEKFTFFMDNGLDIRWFQFDRGGSVTWKANSTGQPGLTGGGFAEFQSALQAWNNEPTTPIRYLYGGTTTATGGLTRSDGVNAIVFNDPNQEIDAVYSCTSGGVLAVSGPWYIANVTGRFNGSTFVITQEADVITNDGVACFFQQSRTPSKAAEELFGHELGHTLGLGHSCGDDASGKSCADPTKNDALMRAFIHDDGRGARLGTDDIGGIDHLYGPAALSGPCKPSATALCLEQKRFRVEVTWKNQFDGSTGVGRPIPRTDATGFFTFGDPSNVELLVKILDFGTVQKFFYGELTNLQFTITVTDTRSGTVKTYTNTTGDCGGIDQNAFASSTSAGALALPKRGTPAATAGACKSDHNTLCLLNGRFSLSVAWANPGNGQTGAGGAGTLSQQAGTFYFTDPGNVELVTKLIQFSDRISFFYGSLSDLPYTITVTDTSTGAVKTYKSTAGKLCGGFDNTAF